MDHHWWQKPQLRLFLDYHTPDHADQTPPGSTPSLQHIDPVSIAKSAKAAGVEALIFYAKDNQGNLHYPSTLGHHLSDLNGRDLVQEFTDALKSQGIRAIACFQPIRDRRTFNAVSSWRQINNDGTERIEQGFAQLKQGGHHLVCPLGGAGDSVMAQLRELVETHDLDGIWWDRVGDIRGTGSRYPCFCDTCQQRFRNETGLEIPENAVWDGPHWRTFWHWRAKELLNYQRRAHDIIHRCGRGACMISNYAFFGMALADPMPVSVDMEAVSDATDVASLECQHFRSYLLMSVNPRIMRALTDRTCEMLAWRAGRIGDGVVRSRSATEATIYTFLAHGHTANFQDTLDHDGYVDPRTFSTLADLSQRFSSMRSHQEGANPLRYAAVLFSPSTFTWYGKGDPDPYVKEFIGTVRQFLKLHIPFEIISDRHLNREDLKNFKLLALPNAACMSDRACESINTWTKEGGVLLASYDTSRFTGDGRIRSGFGLETTLGVSYDGATDDTPRWTRAQTGGLYDLPWGEHPVAMRGKATQVNCRHDTAVLAEMGTPMPGHDVFANFINPVREWGPHPAITHHTLGNGHAVYLAGNLGAMDLQWGIAELIAPYQLVLGMAETPPVRAKAPACVELVAQETRDNAWLVHFINLQGEVGRTHRMPALAPIPQGISEIIPIHDLTLMTSRKISAAQELLDDQTLNIESIETGSRITLPKLQTTACIRLELKL